MREKSLIDIIFEYGKMNFLQGMYNSKEKEYSTYQKRQFNLGKIIHRKLKYELQQQTSSTK